MLLVEDDADHEALAMRSLRRLNATRTVVVARSGTAAMEVIHGARPPAPAGLPQLVLLDLKLSHMSGFDLLRRLRTDPQTTTVPVVVLTSSDEQQDLEISYCLGANNFIQKPMDFARFVQVIGEAGQFWLNP